MSTTVGEVEIAIKGNTLQFKKTINDAEKTIRKFGDVVEDALITSVVQKGFDVATRAVGEFASSIVNVGKKFEKSMSNVAAISGATGADLDAITNKAREMGRETVWSASDAADAMSYMAMAGWKTDDMLSGIGGIMNLATASGADLAATSDIVTDALTAFGLKASDSGRFADVLAAASSNANTNVQMMGETFKYAAPIAGAMGYSVEDTATAIGLMASAGIKGSQAGTSLRSIFTRLASPTKDMTELMEQMGISITNADGTMKPLSEVMGDLRGAFAELTPEQKAQYAQTIAGQEAMSGLLAIVNASPEDFDKLTNAVANSDGAAQQMADTMADNLEGKIAGMNSKMEELQLKIYDFVKPALEAATDAASGLATGLSWVMDNLDWILPVLAGVTAAIVAYQVATNLAAIWTGILTGATNVMAAAQAVLNAVMSLNPIGLIVAAVVGLIVMIGLLWLNCEDFRNFIIGVFQHIGEWLGKVGEFFGELWNKIVEVFGNIGQWFSDKFNEAINNIKMVFGGVTDFFKGIWDKIVGIFTSIGTTVGDAMGAGFKSVVNGVLSAVETILNGPIRTINGLIDVINNIPGIDLGHLPEFSLPRMEYGGIVPGDSYTGDHNLIRANSGEMVITRSQQAALWDMIERGNYDGVENGGDSIDNSQISISNNYQINSALDAEEMGDIILASIRKAVA